MRNRRSVEIMPCLSKAFGHAPSIVAFDAFGDFLFFNSKKRKQKMPLSCAEGCSAQRKSLL